LLCTVSKFRSVITGHTDAVFSVAFGPDGHILATASAESIARLWDVHEGSFVPDLAYRPRAHELSDRQTSSDADHDQPLDSPGAHPAMQRLALATLAWLA
jgi:WD40 repeat protein